MVMCNAFLLSIQAYAKYHQLITQFIAFLYYSHDMNVDAKHHGIQCHNVKLDCYLGIDEAKYINQKFSVHKVYQDPSLVINNTYFIDRVIIVMSYRDIIHVMIIIIYERFLSIA